MTEIENENKTNGDSAKSNTIGEIARPGRQESIPELIEFVSSIERGQGFGEKRVEEIGSALKEALDSAILRAYKEKSGDITITCKLDPWGKLVIAVTDAGEPFNILLSDVAFAFAGEESPADEGTKASAKIIKKLIDTIEYKRVEQTNVLTFTVTEKPRGV